MALKTFVDNVCRQVVERHVIAKLPGIFGPESVAGYNDDYLHRVAAEMPEDAAKRKQLRLLHKDFDESLKDLQK